MTRLPWRLFLVRLRLQCLWWRFTWPFRRLWCRLFRHRLKEHWPWGDYGPEPWAECTRCGEQWGP